MATCAGSGESSGLLQQRNNPRNVTESKKFHQGPEFLKKPIEEWPQWEALTDIYEHDPEIVRLNVMRFEKEHHVVDKCIEKFSKRLKL